MSRWRKDSASHNWAKRMRVNISKALSLSPPEDEEVFRILCEAKGWRMLRDDARLLPICGDDWGIAHVPTLEGRERHNDSIYGTWALCYREAIEAEHVYRPIEELRKAVGL